MADVKKSIQFSLGLKEENNVSGATDSGVVEDGQIVEESISASFEINANDNGGKTSGFTEDEKIRLRYFTSSSQTTRFAASRGSVRKISSRGSITVTEFIQFNSQSEANLSLLPARRFIYSWIGRKGGTVKRSGRVIYTDQEVTGVLQVSYTTYYELIEHSVSRIYANTEIAIIAEQGTQTTVRTVTYASNDPSESNAENQGSLPTDTDIVLETEEDATSSQLKTITIEVRDYTTNNLISGVDVFVDGVFRGTTGGNGTVLVENLTVGSHSLRMTKQGYQASDQDALANDSFTVDV